MDSIFIKIRDFFRVVRALFKKGKAKVQEEINDVKK